MNRSKRIFWSIVLSVLPVGANRIANILRKYKLYGHVGENCHIQKRKIPLYSELIYIHDNVCVGSNVGFVTHDAIHIMLNQKEKDLNIVENVGCIEVMDNVFIGSGTRIMGNIRIGSNVIIGSDSLITKDIPDNTVVSGVPAKVICHFDDFVETRIDYSKTFKELYKLDGIKKMDIVLAQKMYNNYCLEKDKKNKV